MGPVLLISMFIGACLAQRRDSVLVNDCSDFGQEDPFVDRYLSQGPGDNCMYFDQCVGEKPFRKMCASGTTWNEAEFQCSDLLDTSDCATPGNRASDGCDVALTNCTQFSQCDWLTGAPSMVMTCGENTVFSNRLHICVWATVALLQEQNCDWPPLDSAIDFSENDF